MEKVFKVAVVFAATGTVYVPFTKVAITIAENAKIDALRDRLQTVEKLAIPEEGLGRVKLRLAVCDSNADKSPDPRHAELLDLDLEDRLSTTAAGRRNPARRTWTGHHNEIIGTEYAPLHGEVLGRASWGDSGPSHAGDQAVTP
jgi:hypothetical protein